MRPFVSALVAAVLATSVAHALPNVVTHQGRLLQADDTPVDGTTKLVFKLWRAPTADVSGGTEALWTSSLDVPVSKGFYSVILGDSERGGTPFPDGAFDGDRWLSVTIGTTELVPRARLGTAPQAQYAVKAGTAGDLACTGCVADAEIASVAATKITGTIAEATHAATADALAASAAVPGSQVTGPVAEASHAASASGLSANASVAASQISGKVGAAEVADALAASASLPASQVSGKVTAAATADALASTASVPGSQVSGKVATATNAEQLGGKPASAYLTTGGSGSSGDLTLNGRIASSGWAWPTADEGTRQAAFLPRAPQVVRLTNSNPLVATDGGAEYHALRPSVVRVNGVYWMYYAVHNGTLWNAYRRRTSTDGVHWSSPTVVLDNTGRTSAWDANDYFCGSVLRVPASGSTPALYYYFYTAGANGHDQIGYATSTTGLNFVRGNNGDPILTIGSNAWDNNHVVCPSVLREVDSAGVVTWRLWYTAHNTANGLWDGVGLAEATGAEPRGFVKKGQVVTRGAFSDDTGIINVSVVKAAARYYMAYGCATGSIWSTCLATSTDGTSWEKYAGNPFFVPSGGWEGHTNADYGELSLDGTLWMGALDGNNRWQIGRASVVW